MLLPDNGRAGSFVAERILGTSGSSPLLLILIARTPHTLSSRSVRRRTNASEQKPGRRFVLAKPVSSSSGGLIRVVTAPVLVRHDACAVRLIAPVSRLFWIVPAGPFRIPIDDRRTLSSLIATAGTNKGCYQEEKLDSLLRSS